MKQDMVAMPPCHLQNHIALYHINVPNYSCDIPFQTTPMTCIIEHCSAYLEIFFFTNPITLDIAIIVIGLGLMEGFTVYLEAEERTTFRYCKITTHTVKHEGGNNLMESYSTV